MVFNTQSETLLGQFKAILSRAIAVTWERGQLHLATTPFQVAVESCHGLTEVEEQRAAV